MTDQEFKRLKDLEELILDLLDNVEGTVEYRCLGRRSKILMTKMRKNISDSHEGK